MSTINNRVIAEQRVRALRYYYDNRDSILERNNTNDAKQKRKQYYDDYYQKNKKTINEKRRLKKGLMGLRRRPRSAPKHNPLPTNNNDKSSFKGVIQQKLTERANPFKLEL